MPKKNSTTRLQRFKNSLACSLALAAVIGVISSFPQPSALAQWNGDIDSVMEGLDRDFSFGGKREVKRENIETTNSNKREDIKIQEVEPQSSSTSTTPTPTPSLVPVQFSITDLSMGIGDNIQAVITFGGTLASGLDDATVVPTVGLPPGTNQTLSVTCVAALSVSCSYDVTILTAGILFGSPILSNTTGPKSLGIGLTDNYVLPIPAV